MRGYGEHRKRLDADSRMRSAAQLKKEREARSGNAAEFTRVAALIEALSARVAELEAWKSTVDATMRDHETRIAALERS